MKSYVSVYSLNPCKDVNWDDELSNPVQLRTSLYIFDVCYYQWEETCPAISWHYKLNTCSFTQTELINNMKTNYNS